MLLRGMGGREVVVMGFRCASDGWERGMRG